MIVYQWGKATPLDFAKFERLVCWYSCGAASAIATRLALECAKPSGIETAVVYTDTGSEHPDSRRFMHDCERLFAHPVTIIRSEKYSDTWAVWEGERYINGIAGAPCTRSLKKRVREKFERPGDLQVFGYDSTEIHRVRRFAKNQPEVALWCPLADTRTPKTLCFHELQAAGIRLPAMYRLGYRNNNCIGCPKGGTGYWNKIRRDFPDVFERMAKLERKLNTTVCKMKVDGVENVRVFLDELPANVGRYSDEPPVSCGLFCVQPDEDNDDGR